LPSGLNGLFAGSGECIQCHGTHQYAMRDADSNDVSPVADWQATMMANSAKDPFWQAQVSLETLINPGHQSALESKCTACHAPQGHFDAFHSGQTTYTISDMLNDPSCTACHAISPAQGQVHSGGLVFDTIWTVYGQYTKPDSGLMYQVSGFYPALGNHISNSQLCGGCHTLLTASSDSTGTPTGNIFVEQATYQEWVNSDYNLNQVSCQSCHLPRTNDSILVSGIPGGIPPRTPYGKHHLVGGNSFMLNLMSDNINRLGITANRVQFDSVIARTDRQLSQRSVTMDLTMVARTNDTAFFDLSLQNLCGHKFPTGYPSRRAFIHFFLINDYGDTIFNSGQLGNNYYLEKSDSIYDPHHQVIRTDEDVQIYELVMQDFYGNKTTVLEKADAPLKDNRIPPIGFNSSHFTWDSVKIVGNAMADPDFNLDSVLEGTGMDVLHFHVPLNGYEYYFRVEARLYYQSVPPKWLETMFQYSSSEINLFKNLYDAADGTPVLCALDTLSDGLPSPLGGINDIEGFVVEIFPNPATDFIFIKTDKQGPVSVKIWSGQGEEIYKRNSHGSLHKVETSSWKPGVYYVEVDGKTVKIVVL